MIEHLEGYLRMVEDEVEDRIPCTDLTDRMDTLVEDGHDTDLFFEVFFCILFLIELGVRSWEGDLEIDHTMGHEHFIRKSHDSDTYPCKDNKEDDIDYITSDILYQIPET